MENSGKLHGNEGNFRSQAEAGGYFDQHFPWLRMRLCEFVSQKHTVHPKLAVYAWPPTIPKAKLTDTGVL